MIGIGIVNSLGLNKLSGINPDAAAFIAAANITNTTQISAINTLVNGLQSDGLWSKMKAVYPFVTDNRNLLGYTEDFSNGYWIKDNLTSSSLGTPPIGLSTSFKIADSTNTTTSHFFIPNFSAATSVQYTASAYFKAAEYEFVQIHPTANNGCVFNLTAGTYNILGAGTATISNVGNGWYRCTFTFTATGATVHISPNKTSTSQYTYASTIGNGIYMSSPQVELGSTATTYQPIVTTQQAYIANQFKYNLKDPRDLDAAFRLVFNGGWTHSSTGATPNGTNGYADTKLNQAGNLTPSNNHISFYSRTSLTSAATQIDCGITDNASYSFSQLAIPLGTTFRYENGSQTQQGTFTNTLGLFLGASTSSTSSKLYKNGISIASSTTAQSRAMFNNNIYLATSNFNTNSSPVGVYSSKQLGFSTIGDGLLDTEAANLYTRVQAFQTSLSRQV